MTHTSKHLIPIGFYRELRGGKSHEPSLRDAVRAAASPHEADTIRYLGSGHTLIATGGVVNDVLDPSFGIIGPPHILTDGTYAWPAILSHYVERYHVKLPTKFSSYMMANNWTVPSDIDLRALAIDRDQAASDDT